MTELRPPIDPTLLRLGDRICAAAGTDLGTVLDDLATNTSDPRTPAAIRSGWQVPDTTIPAAEGTATA